MIGEKFEHKLVEKLIAIRDGEEGDRNAINQSSYQVRAAIALAYMEEFLTSDEGDGPDYAVVAKIMEGTA